MKKSFLFIALAGLIISLQLSGQSIGDDAPDFEVNLLGGGTFKLSDNSGKVVFIFFFGNTCPYCEDAVPSIEANIYSEFKNDPAFVAVGLDTWSSSDETSVNGFKVKTGISFPLGLKAGSVKVAYGSTHDRLIVVDKLGKIAHKTNTPALSDVNNARNAIVSSLGITALNNRPTEDAFNIYPNPASDFIYLKSTDSNSGNIEVEIFELSGRKVYSGLFEQNFGDSDVKISLEGLKEGIYMVRLVNGEETRYSKFVVSW